MGGRIADVEFLSLGFEIVTEKLKLFASSVLPVEAMTATDVVAERLS